MSTSSASAPPACPVWVTVVESVDQALAIMRRLLVDVLGADEPAWLAEATAEWGHPADLPPTRVVVPIWRDPWMVVGGRTFTGDMVVRLGLAHRLRRRRTGTRRSSCPTWWRSGPSWSCLPDEPYPFAPDDGPEAFPDIPTTLVSGRDLTWYGPSMATAAITLTAQVEAALGPTGVRRHGRSEPAQTFLR